MSTIQKRSELLFLYDIRDANPNGDPIDENKPRIDEETGINIVTDVRLKRTIRDYLFEYKGFNGENDKDIFVRQTTMKENDPDSGLKDGKTRAKDFKEDPDTVKEKCIDVRLFGGVIPLSKSSITYTGPVQFKMGRSLHPVEMKHLKGTGAFASKPGAHQNTFREEFVLPYSLIGFHGIINEAAAQHTDLSEDDITFLLEGMWHGTKNLISRSKAGQMPRLLLKVTYKERGFFVGDLERKIKIKGPENLLKIRGVEEFKLDISELVDALNIDEVEKIEIKIDKNLKTEPAVPENWKELEV